jgi:hypothetical protein
MLRRILEAIRCVANILAEMTGQIFDFHLAFKRHWTARSRRRFINADLGVFSLADEVDFLKFCRELKKPADPELEAWREWDDFFEDVTKFDNA